MGILRKLKYTSIALSAGITTYKVAKWIKHRKARQPETIGDLIANEKRTTAAAAERP